LTGAGKRLKRAIARESVRRIRFSMKSPAPLTLGDALKRVYSVPLGEFVTLRRDLAGQLRASGDLAGARELLAAKKPSRTAWALNQLARRHPDMLRAALEAHTAALKAQSHGADAVRDSVRAFRDRIGDCVRQCSAILAEAGAGANATQSRLIGETVRAAIQAPDSRERLLEGLLTEDIEVEDPFAGLTAGSHRGARLRIVKQSERSATATQEQEMQRARQERAREMEHARREVERLEEQARDARTLARQAETAAHRAQTEADRARAAVVAIEQRLEKARTFLKSL
jgi:hypothetical protein